MYTTQSFTATISVKEYLERYVDIPTFLECCKACPNYDKIWSCPPYDFDVLTYWNQYTTLELFATKIIFDAEYAGQIFTKDEQNKIMEKSLKIEKELLSEKLLQMEHNYAHAASLSAGSCPLCHGDCPRANGQACRYPDKMRYSIESLGGNVGLTLDKLMGIELEWMEEGRLPNYFVLVSGLLHE